MALPPLPVIHEVLPTEVLGAIFEEHAKVEWKAPAIDGRVCRFWRQTILNTPRAWAHLTINRKSRPGIGINRFGIGINRPGSGSLTSWLSRSGSAPLHIDVLENFTPDKHYNNQTLYDLLCDHYNRIEALRIHWGDHSYFQGRNFPCLQRLDVYDWFPVHPSPAFPWGAMPKLRSLRLGATNVSAVPLSTLDSFRVLILHNECSISLPQSFNSLTRLMLDDVLLVDPISGPVAFHSLIYLSLYDVNGLKPHIDAPCLITYHEGGYTVEESFSAPLPSLIEYGVYYPHHIHLNIAEWRLLFPNILRLSLRGAQDVLFSWIESLADQPHMLPALQEICIAEPHGMLIPENTQRIMENLVKARREAHGIDVMLYFEPGPSFRIPLYFGDVSVFFIRWPRAVLTQIPGTRLPKLTTVWFQALTNLHPSRIV